MITDSEFLEISPEVAKSYLDDLYVHQRPLSLPHVKALAKVMKNGDFDPTSPIAIASMSGKEKVMLLNGQHTLRAVVESCTTQKLLVVYYDVENGKEMSRLYSHFDIGRKRTFADSVRAYGLAEQTGLLHTHIIKASAALRYMIDGFPRGKSRWGITNEELMELVTEWKDEINTYFDATYRSNGTTKVRSSSAAPLAVQLIILKHQPDKGIEFVGQSVLDDGLSLDDPRKALYKYFGSVATSARSTGKVPQTNGQMARAVAKCWNAYYSKSTLTRVNIKPAVESKPFPIKGTPYK